MLPRPFSFLPADWPLADASAFALLLSLAMALGVVAVLRDAARRREAPHLAAAALALTLAGGLAGARLWPWLTGTGADQLVAWGAYVGGALAGAAAARLLGIGVWAWLDRLAPPAALGIAVGRVGCFLSGCDYGAPAGAWPGVTYPAYESGLAGDGPPAWLDHVAHGWIDAHAAHSLPVHPVQLYESALGLILLALVTLTPPGVPGRRVETLALGYALGRFGLEFLRGDADRGVGLWGSGLSQAQLVSLALVAIIALNACRRATKKPRTTK